MIRLVIILLIIILIFEYKTKESFKNNQIYEQKYLNDPNKIKNINYKRPSHRYYSSDINDPIFKKEKSLFQTLKFDPVSVNIDSKYKLYGDVNLDYKEAGKIYLNDKPNIDQRINTNIINYINKNEINEYNDFQYKSDLNLYNHIISLNKDNEEILQNKEKTIKDIYDELTNDNRLELQQNLDELEAFDENRNDYRINEKYGATRFDTYSID